MKDIGIEAKVYIEYIHNYMHNSLHPTVLPKSLLRRYTQRVLLYAIIFFTVYPEISLTFSTNPVMISSTVNVTCTAVSYPQADPHTDYIIQHPSGVTVTLTTAGTSGVIYEIGGAMDNDNGIYKCHVIIIRMKRVMTGEIEGNLTVINDAGKRVNVNIIILPHLPMDIIQLPIISVDESQFGNGYIVVSSCNIQFYFFCHIETIIYIYIYI